MRALRAETLALAISTGTPERCASCNRFGHSSVSSTINRHGRRPARHRRTLPGDKDAVDAAFDLKFNQALERGFIYLAVSERRDNGGVGSDKHGSIIYSEWVKSVKTCALASLFFARRKRKKL